MDHPHEIRPGIPPMREAVGCNRADCPGRNYFETHFGLAGGGYGVYLYCPLCEQIRGKDQEPTDVA